MVRAHHENTAMPTLIRDEQPFGFHAELAGKVSGGGEAGGAADVPRGGG